VRVADKARQNREEKKRGRGHEAGWQRVRGRGYGREGRLRAHAEEIGNGGTLGGGERWQRTTYIRMRWRGRRLVYKLGGRQHRENKEQNQGTHLKVGRRENGDGSSQF
jgi:hypothetical protein